MKTICTKLLLTLIPAAALCFGSANAELVFSDDFESKLGNDFPDATNNTAQGDGVSATGGWTQIESGDNATVVNDTILGNSLSLIDVNGRPSVAAGFASTTLNTGDIITLSFDFNVVKSTANGSYLRFGFWNTANLDGHDTGTSYWGKVSTSPTAGDTGIWESTSPGINFTAIDSLGTVGTGGVSFNTKYSVNFSITKTLSGVDLSYEILDSLGASLFSVSGSDASYDTFNAIGFRVNETGGGDTVRLDNVSVDFTVVPEPSTYAALLGVLALGFVVYRRRRR